MRMQENSINTFIFWSSFRVDILDSQKCQQGNFFHFWSSSLRSICFFRYQVSHTFRYFGDFFGNFCYQYQFLWELEFFQRLFWWFLVGCYRFFGFFRLQVEFIKCWNKLKMQIIIFIPPSADSSCSTARVALLICFESSLSLFVNYLLTFYIRIRLIS